MFLNQQEAMYVEGGGISASTRFRVKIYKLMHELFQIQTVTPFIYKLLLLLEAFQFMWWTLRPRGISVWDISVFQWVQQFLKYFQVDGPLADNDSQVFASLVYTVFGVQILVVSIIGLNAYLISKSSIRKGSSTVLNYTSKILSIYVLLLTNILPLPFFQVFFSSFFCFSDDRVHSGLTCYQGVYWVYPILSCVGILILLVTSFLATLLSIDLNPWSKTPYSAAQSRLNLIKLGFKILIPLYGAADYKAQYTEGFLICYGVIWMIILVLRYRQIPHYNRSVFHFMLGLEMGIFWSVIVTLFHVFFDDSVPDNMGFLFWLLIMPFVIYTYIVAVDRRTKVYREFKLKQLTKDVEVEMYIINLIDLIEQRENHYKMMTLEGFLKYHVRSCIKKSGECLCYDLIANYNNDEEAPEKSWYLWVKSIIIEAIEKFPKSSKLHLLYAYIQKEKLDNKFKALFELMLSLDSKPNTEEEFSIFRYKSIIEEEIIENDLRHIESKGIDVNLIVEFENKYVDFQSAIEAAVEAHLDFWRELLENSPEIQKLQTLGSYITKSLEEAENQYKKLCVINSNHVKMLKIYGFFLKDVVNDENEGQRILDKAEQVNKSSVVNRQFIDEEKLKYGDNSNPVIITCSGNFTTMGTVLNANNEVFRLLGYSKAEMIGQNISHIMPKPLGDEHDDIMKNYFETAKVKAIGLERNVFPVTKQGYITPCSLMIKVLPNLSEGLKVVGFLKELEREPLKGHEDSEVERAHYVVYDGRTGAIHGISRSCKREFGIHASLVKGSNLGTNEFTVDAIFPDLMQWNNDDLRGANGVMTTINTSSLKENYMIQNDNSEIEQYSEQEQREEEHDNRYRVAQINVMLMQDEEYGEFNLRVLRFVEIADEGDLSNSQFPADHNAVVDKSNIKSENPNKEVNAEEEEGDKSGDGGASEDGSSTPDAAGPEVNDDIRLLKDFKALISEKTLPKSIKILRNAVIFFAIIFIVLISVGLAFNLSEVSEFQNGVVAVNTAYKRVDTIADVTWRLRKLQLFATSLFVPIAADGNVEKTLKAKIASLTDILRNQTLSIGDNQGKITSLGFPQVEIDPVSVQSVVQSGTKLESRLFSDSMSQLTSHATSAGNANISFFYLNDITDSTKASFFFVRRNGLFPLREKAEANAEAFKGFYLDRTATYDSRFLIIMVLALTVLFISELILVPIVFSVHKTATKVLSLFGYITTGEISELAARCEEYMDKYLEHRHEKQAFAEEEHDNVLEEEPKASKTSRAGNEYLEVSQHHDDPNGSREERMEGIKKDEVNVAIEVRDKDEGNGKSGKTTSLVTKKSMNKNLKDEEKKLQEEEDAEQGNARSQKLLNSKDNNKGTVICQFTFIIAVIAMYFVVDYTTELNSQSNIKMSLEHLRLLSRVNMNFRYLSAFTLEELAEGTVSAYTFPNHAFINMSTAYNALSLDSFKALSESAKSSFPAEFDSYKTLFNLYITGDLCATYYNRNATIQSQCLGISGQLLKNGLTLGTTRIAQFADDLVKSFGQTNQNNTYKASFISGDKYREMENLMNFVAPVMESLETNMINAFEDYLTKVETIEKIKFAVFIVFAFLLFVGIWSPYLRRLKEKIFRTKGMLNMIPMNIITKNDRLKSAFIEGDILQAVK